VVVDRHGFVDVLTIGTALKLDFPIYVKGWFYVDLVKNFCLCIFRFFVSFNFVVVLCILYSKNW
jgi:hypothetical protein